MAPSLANALLALNLSGTNELETRILSQPGFLGPWADYRDDFLFRMLPSDRTSLPPIDFTNHDLSIFQASASQYREAIHGGKRLDKSTWGALEHARFLCFAIYDLGTPIQNCDFDTGREYFNTDLFDYGLAKALDVIAPIVQAVRTAYHPDGPEHYGRLARFVEAQLEGIPPSTVVPPGVASSSGDEKLDTVQGQRDDGATGAARLKENRMVVESPGFWKTFKGNELDAVIPDEAGAVNMTRNMKSIEASRVELKVEDGSDDINLESFKVRKDPRRMGYGPWRMGNDPRRMGIYGMEEYQKMLEPFEVREPTENAQKTIEKGKPRKPFWKVPKVMNVNAVIMEESDSDNRVVHAGCCSRLPSRIRRLFQRQ
ncbi:hypothetical protein K432DRAFT_387136 [Lepidopterella palustris CBS 459.81]|uniref:Uncharacterized protein n=1 Tax=Lepidopterella palustris CBS 459.81 TaxID=1314670 RepID=A0A8E2J9M9_9PEZI|nr:hypothetical protein K432DRAFT_387136 [Lepidopterella palustris CBS 459.81]